MNNVFYVMANNIFSKNFEEALANLKEYITINKNNKNVLLYALLLEELLKNNNLDFNFINTLNSFGEDKVEGYQMYYKLAFDSVLKKDYEQALKYLKEYKTYEKKHSKNNSLDIVLLEILLEEVNNNKSVVINNPTLNNPYYLFKQYFQKLQDDIKSENYLEALNDCQIVKKYTVANKIKFYNNIENLLNKIIEMEKNKTILKKETMVYPNIENYNFVLDLALKNGDYKTAYRNVGKVIYYESSSIILKIYQQLLYKINLLNNKNLKEIEIKNKELIICFIKTKDYENLKRLLNNYEIEFYASLLNIIKDIENGNYLNASKSIELFIKKGNNKEIYQALLSIIMVKDKSGKKEFDDKIMVLYDDILHTNSKIDLEIKIDSLKELLINKNNILELNQDEKNILNLITIYFNVNNSNIDLDNYFARIKKEDNIMDYFNKAMFYGDYSSAYQIMNSDEWFKNIDKVKNSTYYSVIRKILIVLNIKNNKKIVKKENEITIDNHYLDCLANLKRLIKKRKFEEAYQFLCENDFSYNENSRLYYEMLLKYLINLKRGETESLNR